MARGALGWACGPFPVASQCQPGPEISVVAFRSLSSRGQIRPGFGMIPPWVSVQYELLVRGKEASLIDLGLDYTSDLTTFLLGPGQSIPD